MPLLVIPLRTRRRASAAAAHWFPEVGYNSYEGAWIKIQIPFGKDQYYYGYYIVNYYTKEGLGLGYVGFYTSKNGRRSVSVNLYTINNRLAGGTQTNFALQEQENFSQHLRGNFQFDYQSNYGPLISIPPNETISAAIAHQTAANVPELQLQPQLRRRTVEQRRALRLPTRASSTRTSTRRRRTT